MRASSDADLSFEGMTREGGIAHNLASKMEPAWPGIGGTSMGTAPRGFFQNPACDWCDDVVAETADISFGDARVEPYSSDGNGTNVTIVRTRELQDMLEMARAAGRLNLKPVDANFIANTRLWAYATGATGSPID